MVWLSIALIIIMIIGFLLLFFSTLNIRLEYEWGEGKKHTVRIYLHLFGLSIKKKKLDLSNNNKTQPKQTLSTIKKVNREMRNKKAWMKRKITLDELIWHTSIGSGEVISTGISAGSCWALKENLILLTNQYIHIACQPNIHVTPIYEGIIFQTKMTLEGRVRLLAAYRLYKNFKKVLDT